MPMVVAPVAGALSDRLGAGCCLASGLGLQALGHAWNAAVTEAGVGYASLVGSFVISGIGMWALLRAARQGRTRLRRPRRRGQGVWRQQRRPRRPGLFTKR
jgi:hypothetical protein